jgi:hypothetical protein
VYCCFLCVEERNSSADRPTVARTHKRTTACQILYIDDLLQWEDGKLPQMKAAVKQTIEEMARRWSDEERSQCVDATAAAFQMGAALNSYLFRGPTTTATTGSTR